MAWLVGCVNQEELTDLRSRGWEDVDPPVELSREVKDGDDGDDDVARMFYVDSDLHSIMTGGDW